MLSPIEGGPAQRAGIVTGDEILQIDGKKIVMKPKNHLFSENLLTRLETADVALAGMNNEEVATRLRGRAGTSVTLKVRRAVSLFLGL